MSNLTHQTGKSVIVEPIEGIEAVAEVLFLDDELPVLKALQRVFHNEPNLNCQFASSPKEALEILTSTCVDVIVSDHRMPLMTGADFLARVKEKRPKAIRMMLTGQADLSAVQKAINEGEIYRFLLKPWKDEELRSAVRQAVEYGRLLEENQRLLALTKRQNAQLAESNGVLEEQVEARTGQLADALYTARALNEQLEDALYTGTKVFFSLIQSARPDIGSHGRRVAEHAVEIGKVFKLGRQELRDLEIAALLHDGGKLGFPTFLAEKHPSDLTREELELYRTHPSHGTDYLRGIKFYERIATIIVQHHERYDGNGFPAGLMGTETLLESYIVGIVDTYDHLVMRPSQSPEFAYQFAVQSIADMSDKQYPARVVQAVLDYIAMVNDRRATDNILKIGAADLAPSYVLARDLYTMSGSLLAASGTCLTAQNIARIRAIVRLDPAAGEIWIVRKSRRQAGIPEQA
jgi:response regulator RpfG family c-di-GMP phosphodiesterase